MQRTETAVERVMAAFDDFQREISALHAPEIADLSLTLAQLKAIYLVATGGPIRMGDLAEQMRTAPSTASGLVDRLVQLGLLDRFEDPANRRQVLVRATPTATQQVQAMSELNRDRLRQLLSHMKTTDEIETIERALRLMTAAASEMSTEINA
jgi:DNA-binding MarR family transcriptional regulator